jgi:hypothetical protein
MSDARDRLMDALLRQHLGEGSPQMEQRYARAFAALDAAEGSPLRNPTRARALRIARAALVVLCAGTMLLLLPVESNAMGVIAGAVSGESRARGADDERRYEVELRFNRPAPGGGRDRELVLRGNWDMRGDESRLELRASDGPSLVRVDARDGAWEQREGGAARALESSELWPRWIEDRSGRIAVERMDELLRLVQRSYDVAFARAGEESPVALRGSLHLVADRRGRVPGPSQIDLWIDTDRNVVLEAQLRWLPSQPPARGDRPPRGAPPQPQPPRPAPEGDDDYRTAPGALPPHPPRELRLRRIEPIAFPADHFTKPARSS